jgi:hypothetical protein
VAADPNDLDVPGVEPDASGHALTVLELLEEMKQELDRQKGLIEEAEYRERICLGEQWITRAGSSETSLPSSAGLDDGYICENLTYPLVLTYAAVIDQGRIDPRGFPFQPTAQDIESAKAVNTILDFEKQRCSEPELISEAAEFAQMHGDVYFYPQWSEAEGPHRVLRQKVDQLGPVVLPNGQPDMEEAWEFGGVVEEVVAAPDYWTDGAYHFKDASMVCVRRIIDRHVAKQRLRSVRARAEPSLDEMGQEVEGEPRFPDADPKASDFPTAMDTKRRGVECHELWLKPGPRSRSGAYMLIVDGKACVAIPYPEHPETKKKIYDGQLPGAVWKIGNIRGSPRGKTHVSDAIHQQKLVNTSLQSILARAEIAQSCPLVGPSGLIDEMKNATTKRIPHDSDKDLRATTSWFEGPGIPESLMKVYHDARQALRDVFGVSAATSTGGDPSETKSGVQMREAKSQDGQKIRPARGRLEQARKKVAKDKITLWQVHADEARLVRVLGPGGDVAATWLRGADLEGADVALEIGSGVLNSRIGGQKYAEESAAAGLLSPGDAVERRETGLAQTVGDAQGMARVDSQARSAAQGKPVEPMPDVNPKMAMDRLQVVLGTMAVDGEDISGVVQLAQAYRALASAMAKSKAQGPPEPMGGKPRNGAATKVTPTREAQGEPQ